MALGEFQYDLNVECRDLQIWKCTLDHMKWSHGFNLGTEAQLESPPDINNIYNAILTGFHTGIFVGGNLGRLMRISMEGPALPAVDFLKTKKS